MATFLAILVLLPTIIVVGIVDAGLIMAGLFALDKYMGSSHEVGAFDFSTTDKKLRQEFIVRSMLHGLIPAAAALLIGFLIYMIFPSMRHRDFLAALILLPIHYAGVYFPAIPIQKIEIKRALILAAIPTVFYVLLHTVYVGSLLH